MITRRQLLAGAAALAAGCTRAESNEPEPPESPEPSPRRPSSGTARGMTRLDDRVDGVERSAALFVPDGYDPAVPTPLVLAVHGSNQRPGTMYSDFGWKAACEARGWIGLFPKVDKSGDGTGDNDFLLHLLDRVGGEYNVHAGKVYGAGFSGGCRKMYRLAAEHSDRLAAIAVSSGVVSYEGEVGVDPADLHTQPLSIAHVHGGRDTRVPLAGGNHQNKDGRTRRMMPTREALQRWIDHLDLQPVSSDRRPDGLPSRVDFARWRRRPAGHALWLMIDPELGHNWATEWATPVLADFLAAAPTK